MTHSTVLYVTVVSTGMMIHAFAECMMDINLNSHLSEQEYDINTPTNINLINTVTVLERIHTHKLIRLVTGIIIPAGEQDLTHIITVSSGIYHNNRRLFFAVSAEI